MWFLYNEVNGERGQVSGKLANWRILLFWSGLVLPLVLLLANLLSLRLAGSQYTVDVGFRADRHYLEGFYKREQDEHGNDYRWSTSHASLIVANFAAPSQAFLRLNIGGLPHTADSPRPVRVYLPANKPADGQDVDENSPPWTTLHMVPQPRRYTMLLPPDALHDGNLYVALRMDTSQVPPDRRDVGIRLDSLVLGWAPGTWVLPTWHTLLVQWAMVLAAVAGAWRLAVARRWLLLWGGGLVLLLAWITGYDPFVAATWQQRLLAATLAGLVLIVGLYPRLTHLLPAASPLAARRELRLLLLLTLAVIAVRLLAGLYPTFDSHDWYIHEDRQHLFQQGNLLLFDRPAEFSRRVAIVPPAFYILVAPFYVLVPDTVPITQGLYGFLDGCAVLLLAVLVRQLGGSPRAAWLALLLLACLPIQYTALWWGFGPQIIGQALMLLLAVFVAHSDMHQRWLWLVAFVVFSIIILTHNGVALLGGFWLAGYVGLVVLLQRHNWRHWLGWSLLVAAVGVVSIGLLYIDVVMLQLSGLSSNERLAFTEEDIFRVKWTLGSLCVSFQPLATACDQFVPGNNPAHIAPQIGVTLLSMLLPLAGIGALLAFTRQNGRWLVAAWLASALLFFAVDLRFGLQVRYAYFAVPMVCAGLGLLLDRLIRRHPWVGGSIAAALVLLTLVSGLSLWYSGVVEAVKPSLRLLTH